MRQFRIRDLIALTAIVALSLAWWSDHQNMHRRAQQALSNSMRDRLLLVIADQELRRIKNPTAIAE